MHARWCVFSIVFLFNAMSQKIYISPEGLEKLEAELKELKSVKVKEISARIEAAKALGDLKENAEYHAAKDEMGMAQSRIREIEEMLKNIELIEEGKGGDNVRIGSTVEVESRNGKKTLKIVGSTEADPLEGLVSNESPIGRAFLGAKKGDEVRVEAPGGIVMYKILEVR